MTKASVFPITMFGFCFLCVGTEQMVVLQRGREESLVLKAAVLLDEHHLRVVVLPGEGVMAEVSWTLQGTRFVRDSMLKLLPCA